MPGILPSEEKMIKIILAGANGRMGKAVAEAVLQKNEYTVVAGFDTNEMSANTHPFPVFSSPDDYEGEADVIIDFSHHTSVDALLKYAKKRSLPLIICTTGHTDEEIAKIEAASASNAIFRSGNMSLGINLLVELCRRAAAALEGFDIEIIERHHNQKLDAPSGTAIMLADAVSAAKNGESEYVYERQSRRQKRNEKEIGIHSVRGGSIVGQHDVIFAGEQECITLCHTAESRSVFAEGALRAAKFMAGKKSGLYSMKDVIAGII